LKAVLKQDGLYTCFHINVAYKHKERFFNNVIHFLSYYVFPEVHVKLPNKIGVGNGSKELVEQSSLRILDSFKLLTSLFFWKKATLGSTGVWPYPGD